MPLYRLAGIHDIRCHALALVEQAIAATQANLPRLRRLAADPAPHLGDVRVMLQGAQARLERLAAQRERLVAGLGQAGHGMPHGP